MKYLIAGTVSNTIPGYWPGPKNFYPRQVHKKTERKMRRLAKRLTPHEVEIPAGYEWENGKEVSLKYEDGKFLVVG